jgi:hypothetical protein
MDVLDTNLDLNATITGCTPIGRGNKFGQASVVRVSITNHSLKDGIYAADFAGCPEKLPRRTPILTLV